MDSDSRDETLIHSRRLLLRYSQKQPPCRLGHRGLPWYSAWRSEQAWYDEKELDLSARCTRLRYPDIFASQHVARRAVIESIGDHQSSGLYWHSARAYSISCSSPTSLPPILQTALRSSLALHGLVLCVRPLAPLGVSGTATVLSRFAEYRAARLYWSPLAAEWMLCLQDSGIRNRHLAWTFVAMRHGHDESRDVSDDSTRSRSRGVQW